MASSLILVTAAGIYFIGSIAVLLISSGHSVQNAPSAMTVSMSLWAWRQISCPPAQPEHIPVVPCSVWFCLWLCRAFPSVPTDPESGADADVPGIVFGKPGNHLLPVL